MKTLILFLWCMISAIHAEDDLLHLDAVTKSVSTLVDQQRNNQGFQLEDLKNLHQALAGNRPNVWAMPPWMLGQIRDSIEPVRSIARDLTLSKNKHERFYGAVLNSYLLPTPESIDLLIKLADDNEAPTAGTALDALFGMKLETSDIREKLANDLERMANGERPRTLAYTNAGKWGLVEAVPSLMKIVDNAFTRSGKIDTEAVEQLKRLGLEASPSLPLLRRLLAIKKKEARPNFRDVEALEHAVIVISGNNVAGKDNGEKTVEYLAPLAVRLEGAEHRETNSASGNKRALERGECWSVPRWLVASSISILLLALARWLHIRKSRRTSS